MANELALTVAYIGFVFILLLIVLNKEFRNLNRKIDKLLRARPEKQTTEG